ncbi:uncharacterized protein LOC134102915 [Pungitius pungitius]|uniref:uncharacterized protein LOC134102915 n=1 Tax=Pungitius pungitius TaxID=134920 RepID=UPI002E0D5865
MNLAKCLVELRRSGLVSVARILSLWDKLPEGDKGPLTFPRRYQETLNKGRFCKTKSAVHAASSVAEGLQSMRRQGSGPSSNPDSSRLVEAICILQPQGCSLAGARISRWTLILRNYCTIRDSVLANQSLRTKLQLFEVNQRTLIQWFNWRKGIQEGHVLQIGIPSASCSVGPTAASHGPAPPSPHQPAAPLPGMTPCLLSSLWGLSEDPHSLSLRRGGVLWSHSRRWHDAGGLTDRGVPRTTVWRLKKKHKQ